MSPHPSTPSDKSVFDNDTNPLVIKGNVTTIHLATEKDITEI